MSFPNKGRNLRPPTGKICPGSYESLVAGGDYDFAVVISLALRDAFGDSRAAVKAVGACTQARERTVKNWFEAKNAPNGRNLVRLAAHSDEILEAFLMMAGRRELLSAKILVDARDTLAGMLETITRLQRG